jgi:hypothetical protein
VEGHTLAIGVSKEGDHRKAISERLFGLGLVPLSISEKTSSLEEAFITITQDTVHAIAGDGGT